MPVLAGSSEVKDINNSSPPSPFFEPSKIPPLCSSFSPDDLFLTTLRKQKYLQDSRYPIQPLTLPCSYLLCNPTCNQRWNIYARMQNQSTRATPSHLLLLPPKGIVSGTFSCLLQQHYFSSVLACFHQYETQTSLFLLS